MGSVAKSPKDLVGAQLLAILFYFILFSPRALSYQNKEGVSESHRSFLRWIQPAAAPAARGWPAFLRHSGDKPCAEKAPESEFQGPENMQALGQGFQSNLIKVRFKRFSFLKKPKIPM